MCMFPDWLSLFLCIGQTSFYVYCMSLIAGLDSMYVPDWLDDALPAGVEGEECAEVSGRALTRQDQELHSGVVAYIHVFNLLR